MNHRAALLFALLAFLSTHATAQDAVFQRVFGMPRMLPTDIVEQVKALPPGEKLERDADGDGVADQLWYLDTAKRHTISPLLVCVVDEDGDLAETGRGDLDSDCYFWDHGADGSIDVVTDYQDVLALDCGGLPPLYPSELARGCEGCCRNKPLTTTENVFEACSSKPGASSLSESGSKLPQSKADFLPVYIQGTSDQTTITERT